MKLSRERREEHLEGRHGRIDTLEKQILSPLSFSDGIAGSKHEKIAIERSRPVYIKYSNRAKDNRITENKQEQKQSNPIQPRMQKKFNTEVQQIATLPDERFTTHDEALGKNVSLYNTENRLCGTLNIGRRIGRSRTECCTQ